MDAFARFLGFIFGVVLYLGAPVVAMFNDAADKLDVVITLLAPPPIDWLYLWLVLYS